MVSLKQVQLLEEKVDSVVERVTKLQYENSALRSRNAELKGQNEQLVRKVADLQEALSLYEMDKDRIEQGVERALQRLNTIENSVLRSSGEEEHEQPNDAAIRAVDDAFAPANESVAVDGTSDQSNDEEVGFVFDNSPAENVPAASDEPNRDNFSASFEENSVNDDDLEAALAAGADIDVAGSVFADFGDNDGEDSKEETDDSQQFAIY